MQTTETTIFLSMLDNPEYAHLYEEFGKPIKIDEQQPKKAIPAKRRASSRTTTPRATTAKTAAKPLPRPKATAPETPVQKQLETKDSTTGKPEQHDKDAPEKVN